MIRILIQIVPALPPAANGVGDYALAVGCALRRDFGLDTLFVVGNERWQGPEEVEGFRVRRVAARSANNLAEILDAAGAKSESASVLLQLSGYGYSTRGCPTWLLQGLRRWRAKQPDPRLVTMFHELYASGPPWSSAFWMRPAQKMVIERIARRSDVALTNMQLYRELLERCDASKRGKISALAIPSNVGEPYGPPELKARAPKMIVFGRAALRKLTYEGQMAALERACERLGITEVHDVGAAMDGIPERVGGCRITRHGQISASELSFLLSDSVAGFLSYPRAFLAKSGVFAAYCAHRLVPVLPETAEDRRPDADGIEGGVHYLGVVAQSEAGVPAPNPQSIADDAWKWYQGHSLKSHARAFAGAVGMAGEPTAHETLETPTLLQRQEHSGK